MAHTITIKLLRACRTGELSSVRELVASGADLNAKGRHGQSPLHRAAFHGHQPIVAYLIAQGALVGTLDLHGATPLYWAACNGHAAIVRLLLEHGADVNASCKIGPQRYLSALNMSISRGYPQVAQVLVDAGADLTTRYNGRNALETAKAFGSAAFDKYIEEALRKHPTRPPR